MEQELAFGADCVLTLDDIGQLKDYTDTVVDLTTKLQQSLGQASSILPQLLQVMEADPQDTFYLPAFPEFLKLLIAVDWKTVTNQAEKLNRIMKFEMLVVEECLLSSMLGEDILPALVKKMSTYASLEAFQRLLLGMFFRLTDKVVFLEEYQSITDLWGYLSEEAAIATHPDKVEINVAIYLQISEKFARSRKIFQHLQQISPSKSILSARLSVGSKDSIGFGLASDSLKKSCLGGSNLLMRMLGLWQSKLKE